VFAAAHIGVHIVGHPTTHRATPECPSPTGIAKFVKAQAAGILLREKKASEIHVQNVCVSIYQS